MKINATTVIQVALQLAEFSKISEYRKALMTGAKAAIAEAGSLTSAVAKTGRPERLIFNKQVNK